MAGDDNSSSGGPLSSLYSIINFFLNDVVQTNTIGEFIQNNDIHRIDDFTSVAIPDYVFFAIGFVVCVGVGVLLLLLLPVCGSCVGCARCCECCCGCCGGRKQYREDGASSCKKYSCATALFVITAFLMTSSVFGLLATMEYSAQLDPDTGVLNDIAEGIKVMDSYIEDVPGELNDTAVLGLRDTKVRVLSAIDDMPGETTEHLGRETGLVEPLYGLASFTNNMSTLNETYVNMDASKARLAVLTTELSTGLGESRAALGPLLVSCSTIHPDCGIANGKLNMLEVNIDINNTDDVTTARIALEIAMATGIVSLVNDGVEAFENISNVIDEKMSDATGEVEEKFETIEDEVTDVVDDLTEGLEGIDLSGGVSMIDDVKPTFEEYGTYGFYGFLGISSLMILISVLFLLGIVFGLVCPTPSYRSAGCDCTSKQGANFLLAGSCLTFLFSFVIVLLVIVMFTVGWGTETMVCRHLVAYDSSMVTIEELIMKEVQLDFNISLKHAMEECKMNHTFYKAIDPENNDINITDLLDVDKYGIKDLIDDIKNMTIDVGSIQILDPEVNGTVVALDEGLSTVNFDGYKSELDKEITNVSLGAFAAEILDLSEIVRSAGDVTLADDLQTEAQKLQSLHDTNASAVAAEKEYLRNQVDLASEIYSEPMTGIVNSLAVAEANLQSSSNDIIGRQLNIFGDEIYGSIKNFSTGVIYSVENTIGVCGSLYNAGVSVVHAPCVKFLNPLNAVWFCYGWFLAFAVPGLILAIQFADVLRVMTPQPASRAVKPIGSVSMTVNNRVHPYRGPASNTQYMDNKSPVKDNKVYPYPAAGHRPPPRYHDIN